MRERPGASHCSEPLYGEQRRLFYLSVIKIEFDRNKYSQLTEGRAIADSAFPYVIYLLFFSVPS